MAKKRIITQCVSVWDAKKKMYVTESSQSEDYEGSIAECKNTVKQGWFGVGPAAVAGMFDPTKPPAAPPKAPQVVQDLINGVETVTETRDGKDYTITRQLPLTPEQKAIKDDLAARMERIDAISTGLAATNPAYAPMVSAIKDWQSQTRATAFGEANRAQQDELARRGLSNSTAGVQSNAMLALQQGQQTQADAVNLYSLAENQRQTDLQNQANALNLKQGIVNNENTILTNAGNNTANSASNMLRLNTDIANNSYNQQLAAYNAKPASLGQQLLGLGVRGAAAYYTGGMSEAGGLGSSFGATASRSVR